MSESPSGTERTTFGEFALIIGVAIAVAVGMSIWMRSSAPPREPVGGLQAGTLAPALTAPEWINGPPSTDPDAPKVKVVHAWFTTCKYCWKYAPDLVALHDEYGDRVQFIGFAPESPDEREAVVDFVERNGFTWPNGFNAVSTLKAFDVLGFPSKWVIDRSGRVVWNNDSTESIETALDRALAEG